MSTYIWQLPTWPVFTFETKDLLPVLTEVARLQGKVEALSEQLAFSQSKELEAQILSDEIHDSHSIEGERLDELQIYSSLCRRLKVPSASMTMSGAHVEGVVENLLDALENSRFPLTKERIFSWHSRLFPQGRSGPFLLNIGRYRTEPIEVISGSYKNQKVWFEALPVEKLSLAMQSFFTWINEEKGIPAPVKSAIVHLWFLTIHPFEDGNGRISRTVSDYVLNQGNPGNMVLFSISTQLKKRQKEYYEKLHEAQTASMDCTPWILWYIEQIQEALQMVLQTIEKILQVNQLYQKLEQLSPNGRQLEMVKRLTTDFYGDLTTQKWAKLTKCSHDTAMRDIKDLVKKGILKKSEAGGRSTTYQVVLS
ncbi:Fic family protein [uncultured Sphaerochaeta sp.]|uniref:Fic family protein n=1 Tax=uncultured Sphaerochaeta sp. TaxID=886478 RepID=UPI002A0A71B9|nr:Fic family protein [uncultured Sphaerochaeta sp.]